MIKSNLLSSENEMQRNFETYSQKHRLIATTYYIVHSCLYFISISKSLMKKPIGFSLGPSIKILFNKWSDFYLF